MKAHRHPATFAQTTPALCLGLTLSSHLKTPNTAFLPLQVIESKGQTNHPNKLLKTKGKSKKMLFLPRSKPECA
jgi:hypothetical protein